MGRKKRGVKKICFCFYCDRDFDNEQVLIQHQKTKHFKCGTCGKKMTTISALVVHIQSVHKEVVRKVPNAIEGRDDLEFEVYGMEGVPENLMWDRAGVGSQPKKARDTLGTFITPVQKQLLEMSSTQSTSATQQTGFNPGYYPPPPGPPLPQAQQQQPVGTMQGAAPGYPPLPVNGNVPAAAAQAAAMSGGTNPPQNMVLPPGMPFPPPPTAISNTTTSGVQQQAQYPGQYQTQYQPNMYMSGAATSNVVTSVGQSTASTNNNGLGGTSYPGYTSLATTNPNTSVSVTSGSSNTIQSTSNIIMVYDRDDISMEELRAQLPKYKFDDTKAKEEMNQLDQDVQSRLAAVLRARGT